MEGDDGVKEYVKGKVRRIGKYMENPREVHVVLSSEKFRFIVEGALLGDGVSFNSQGRNSDLYTAIDQMVEKLERQIRERRGRGRRKRPSVSSSKRPFQKEKKSLEEKEEEDKPPIIRRKRILAKPMSVEEAASQFALSKQDFLVFINLDSGQMNALYRHKDGSVEWVEPHSK
jgi:putative sigma-54 modulation protein